ncbi:MAG: hypothetical protein Q9224_000903, partial [Gallowayella concinna]
MGRKPNQLVIEYFDRGAKLEDNSNRYEHTCKACGKRFPKGRIESLTSHIEKNCPSISREDRTRIFPQTNPSPQHASHHKGNEQSVLDTIGLRTFTDHQPVLPVSSSRSLTGLEALAEASRQLEHPAESGFIHSSPSQLIDPDLDKAYVDLRSSRLGTGSGEHGNCDAYPEGATDESYVLSYPSNTKPRGTLGHLLEANNDAQDARTLSFIAASATSLEAGLPLNDREHPAQDETTGFQASASQQPFATEARAIHSENDSFAESIDPTDSGQRLPHVIESDPNTALIRPRVDLGPKGQSRGSERFHTRAQKVRGKFTDSRRQEVQEIRKKGACIRCRMLRKTFAHAGNDIDSLTFGAQLDRRKDGQSLEGYEFNVPNLAPVIFIDETTDRICAKMLPYMQATISQESFGEPPLLSQKTFSMAAESKDRLLAQTFDLWYLIQVISSTPDDWDISLTSPDDSSNKRQSPAALTYESRGINTGSSQSRQIIAAQLQAAAEQGASDISRNIMIELERRLERKERCQNFETFFVGVILLNCVERTSWALERVSEVDHPQDWPLGRPAEHYIDQAGHFAEFLSKLYEMRGILLDVRPNPDDGMLHASSGNTEIVSQWLSDLRLT